MCKIGDGGHRSRYLAHAKGTLYHLSYVPLMSYGCDLFTSDADDDCLRHFSPPHHMEKEQYQSALV